MVLDDHSASKWRETERERVLTAASRVLQSHSCRAVILNVFLIGKTKSGEQIERQQGQRTARTAESSLVYALKPPLAPCASGLLTVIFT